ncbi:MAG TPA: c-type cytochrome, partial [Sphingomonadaceae bacterium]|nr:c-type cytochrome [Sphingomonadaceae bacterium]
VFQNVVANIDGASGAVTVNPETTFDQFGVSKLVCPSASGGANYMAGAYSPLTRSLYMPLLNTCVNLSAVEPANDATPGYSIAGRQFIPESAEKLLGVIHAVNAVTGKTNWTFPTRAGAQSLIATGGGLVFAGDADGWFRALDQVSGKVLWQINLGSSVTGYPATFAVDGHQYVAVSTGRWLNDVYTPELVHGTQNTLFVFALPEAGIGHPGPYVEPIERENFNAADPNQQDVAGPTRKAGQGVYSLAQAAAGKAFYSAQCAACHGVDFNPAPGSPPVAGAAFMTNWRGKNLADLYSLVSLTMPPGAGGALSEEQYRALIAYLLEANGFGPGDELPADLAGLRAIAIED